MTLGNYSWVETTNLKALLFVIVSSTVLIGYKIFYLEKETIKVTISKLWLVYYIPSIYIYFLSIE